MKLFLVRVGFRPWAMTEILAVSIGLALGVLLTAVLCCYGKQDAAQRRPVVQQNQQQQQQQQQHEEAGNEPETSPKETEARTIFTNDDLMQSVLSYLPNTYRFVAPVNQQFRRSYLAAHGDKKKRTSEAAAVQTARTAQIWLNEANLNRKKTPFGGPCEIAARYGTLEALQYIRSRGCNWSPWTCHYAASRGSLEILQWAQENGCTWATWTCAHAAKTGKLKELQWLRHHDCPWDKWTCIEAAENGHLEVLQWATANGCEWDPHQILRHALWRDQKVVVSWIIAHRGMGY